MPTSYEDVRTVLERVGARLGPAEAHGLLCGLLCAADEEAVTGWLDELMGERADLIQRDPEAQRVLSALITSSADQLRSEQFELELLLPIDDASLAERTEALGVWCDGFLVGYGLGANEAGDGVAAEVHEVLADFAEIGRIAPQTNESEDAEVAYTELVEFVRVGAMVVQPERRAEEPDPSPRDGDLG